VLQRKTCTKYSFPARTPRITIVRKDNKHTSAFAAMRTKTTCPRTNAHGDCDDFFGWSAGPQPAPFDCLTVQKSTQKEQGCEASIFANQGLSQARLDVEPWAGFG
jgi:hypothetical protein